MYKINTDLCGHRCFITSFQIKALVNISSISNSKNPPLNLLSSVSIIVANEYLKNSARIYFSFALIWNYWYNYKNTWFSWYLIFAQSDKSLCVIPPKAYSQPCQTSKMESFVKIVSDFQLLTIFAKHSILDISEGYDINSSFAYWTKWIGNTYEETQDVSP